MSTLSKTARITEINFFSVFKVFSLSLISLDKNWLLYDLECHFFLFQIRESSNTFWKLCMYNVLQAKSLCKPLWKLTERKILKQKIITVFNTRKQFCLLFIYRVNFNLRVFVKLLIWLTKMTLAKFSDFTRLILNVFWCIITFVGIFIECFDQNAMDINIIISWYVLLRYKWKTDRHFLLFLNTLFCETIFLIKFFCRICDINNVFLLNIDFFWIVIYCK